VATGATVATVATVATAAAEAGVAPPIQAAATQVVAAAAPHIPVKHVSIDMAQHLIDARLAQLGLEREKTFADGNCFFHAISNLFERYLPHLYLPSENFGFFALLRQHVCNYVHNNYATNEIVRDVVNFEYGGNLQEFEGRMRRPGEFAGGDMANVVCVMYDVNLHVHTAGGVLAMHPGTDSSGRERPVLHLAFIGQHWESTRPLSRSANA
jgi:hypothetical protein